jgi:murein DD-endopeptidase MepM/ murein hydrolase activator NlpD
MKKRKIIVLTTLLIVITLVFSVTMPSMYASNSLSSLQSDQANYKKQLDDLKNQLTNIEKDKKKQQDTKQNYDQQAQIIQAQIDNLTSQMSEFTKTISGKETSIASLQADIDKNIELYKQRMRATYMQGDASSVELILGASDFYDFLAKYEIVQSISKHDNDLIEKLKKDKTEIETQKQAVVKSRDQLASTKTQSDSKKAENIKLQKQTATYISNLLKDEATKKKMQDDYIKALAKTEADIEKIKPKTTSGIVTKDFLWPVPNYYTITSPFGYRTSPYPGFHTGIDISGANVSGKNIVATKAGTVALLQYSTTGYGRHLLILHNDGSATLYAHCTSILVSLNQTVSKGQVIATVGTTGNSTGPHLHYEIRIPQKGKLTAVNPMNYYK